MSARLRAAVLGATGTVGQRLVAALAHHPWFEIVHLGASERSAGRTYRDAVHWLGDGLPPASVADTTLGGVEPVAGCEIAFSALDAAVAARVEPAWAAAGVAVISNASALRMDEHVPLVVPEINPDHTRLIDRQRYGSGFIVTNPNCATVGLVAALAPLDLEFGVERVWVTTMQAVSGAGWPGVASLDILGNVVPFIPGEEAKLERETGKILGRLGASGITAAEIAVSAQCCRVPVIDGHVLSIAARLRRPAGHCEVDAALRSWRDASAELALPSAPDRLLAVLDGEAAPQPRLHAATGHGMTVSVGRLRMTGPCEVRLVALVHNTVRGAAGAAVLNAELLVRQGRLATPASARLPATA